MRECDAFIVQTISSRSNFDNVGDEEKVTEHQTIGDSITGFAAAVIVFGRDLGGNGKTSSMYTQFVKVVKYTQFVKGIVKNSA